MTSFHTCTYVYTFSVYTFSDMTFKWPCIDLIWPFISELANVIGPNCWWITFKTDQMGKATSIFRRITNSWLYHPYFKYMVSFSFLRFSVQIFYNWKFSRKFRNSRRSPFKKIWKFWSWNLFRAESMLLAALTTHRDVIFDQLGEITDRFKPSDEEFAR